MGTAQAGIFAVGTAAHCYLEFDRRSGADIADLVVAVAELSAPPTTVGGVNLVVGFRPALWAGVVPEFAPDGVSGFDAPVLGVEGFSMPATQRDVWVCVAGAAQDLVFDVAVSIRADLTPVAIPVSEVAGWSYRHSRDLTGFEDGTENPTLVEAPSVALRPDGTSIVLVQQWQHAAEAWAALPESEQELVMGRTKPDSVELDPLPENSHVARTVVEVDGEELEIFRRNTPYGTPTDHGTMFVGFSHDQPLLARMLARMAGAEDGIRDELTRYSVPLTGAYYVIPPVESLGQVREAVFG